MKKDPHLNSLFKLGIKTLPKSAYDEIVAKLHEELLLNVFHANIANDVKDYKDSKSKKDVDKGVVQCKLSHNNEMCLQKAREQNLENNI
jgi:hypothetical protein